MKNIKHKIKLVVALTSIILFTACSGGNTETSDLLMVANITPTLEPISFPEPTIKPIENMTQHPDVTGNTDEKNTPTPLSDEDFIIKSEKTFIELGSKYENVDTNEKITNVSYLDEKHVYDTYVYENFIVSVSPLKNTVFFINLITPELKTSRGICVGDTLSDVFEKYGLIDGNSYMYCYDYKVLTFYVDKNEKVTNIVLEMI